jgi:NAD(P)-dependent dehydrogenase (short-subunit alcohol dehydrogenase family)
MNLDLTDHVAVVTGASKGIGLAVVEELAEEGARVVAASRNESAELDALGDDVLHVPVDLMDPRAPADVVARAVEAFGGLDILVNNAGGPPPGVSMPRFGFLELTDGTGGTCSSSTCSRPSVPPAPPSRGCWSGAEGRS